MPATKPQATGASAHVVLILVQFLFATFPIAGKLAFEGFHPLAVAVWRVAFGAAVLLPLAWRLHPTAWRLGRDGPRVFLLSFFGVSLNQVMFIEGLSRSSAVTAGFMMGIIPVATYGFALLFRQERFNLLQGLGLMTALVGALTLVIFGAGSSEGGADTLLGNCLLLGNALSYSFYLVLARPVLARMPSLVITAWTFVLALPIVPLAAWAAPWSMQGSSLEPLGALVWILIFPTTLCYFLISWTGMNGRSDRNGRRARQQPVGQHATDRPQSCLP